MLKASRILSWLLVSSTLSSMWIPMCYSAFRFGHWDLSPAYTFLGLPLGLARWHLASLEYSWLTRLGRRTLQRIWAVSFNSSDPSWNAPFLSASDRRILKYTIIGHVVLFIATSVGLGWYVNAFIRQLECPSGAVANLGCYSWGLLQLIVPTPSGTVLMRLLLPLLSAFGVEFVVRICIVLYYKPWRSIHKLTAEDALRSGGNSEWTKHIYPMDWITFWYWRGMCGILLANILNTMSHTRVGGIIIFGLFGLVILFFVFVAIATVILHFCQAINTAKRLFAHQKLMMALHYIKSLFKDRFRNEPDRQIQLEA